MPITSTGTTFAVCPLLPAAITLAGFQALPFTQIKGVRAAGDIGGQYQTMTRNDIGGAGIYQKRIGRVLGELPLELFRIADPGQIMLRGAFEASTSYSYRITQVDGLIMYFTAVCTSRLHGGFRESSIADTKMILSLDSKTIEI